MGSNTAALASPPPNIFCFDLMRCLAATAVVAVHVLGPYRERLGLIPFSDWLTAVLINGASRWAVPVFIMISGALMLSDQRPFDLRYYLRRRLTKVLIPFLLWSVFYAGLSGLSVSGFDSHLAADTLRLAPRQETYYHMGFFYYFLPLYLLIPLLRPLVQRAGTSGVTVLVLAWLTLSGLYLLDVGGVWRTDAVMFGGYLLLGYALWRIQPPWLAIAVPGILALLATEWNAVSASLAAGHYTGAGWFSYKTLNTALIAAAVFGLAMRYADGLPRAVRQRISDLSRHSLGVYLLHPVFLWPARAWDIYPGPAWLMIPLWTLIAGGLAFLTSRWLSRWRPTAWLVP